MTFNTWMTLLSVIERSSQRQPLRPSDIDGRRLSALKKKKFVKVATLHVGIDGQEERQIVLPTIDGQNARRDD